MLPRFGGHWSGRARIGAWRAGLLLAVVAAGMSVSARDWSAREHLRGRPLMLLYVGADDCPPCRSWQQGAGAAFRTTPEFAQVVYREVKSPTLHDVLKDEHWPDDLRAYREPARSFRRGTAVAADRGRGDRCARLRCQPMAGYCPASAQVVAALSERSAGGSSRSQIAPPVRRSRTPLRLLVAVGELRGSCDALLARGKPAALPALAFAARKLVPAPGSQPHRQPVEGRSQHIECAHGSLLQSGVTSMQYRRWSGATI